jgi:hypothetical protein
MIRDGDVGHWPGYDAMRYSLLASPEEAAAARAALSEPPSRMDGWAPPGPVADGDADGTDKPVEASAESAVTDEVAPATDEGAPAPTEPRA